MNIARLAERNVERFGEYAQLMFEGSTFTNVQLLDRASRLAAALADAGVKPGDRVGVMMPNMPEVPITYGAILRCGAVVMPMVFLLAPPEIAHILADSGATFVVTSPEFAPNVRLACRDVPNPPRLIVAGPDAAESDALFLDQMLRDATDPHPLFERDRDDLAVVMYTSGTTGRPKGVMLSHGNLTFNAESAARAVDLRDGDVSLQCLPQSHLFGLSSSVTASMFKITGALLRWFTAEGFFDAVTRLRAASSAVVPSMLTYMLSHPEFDACDWSGFRWVVVGAAPVPVELAEEFERRTGARVLEGYGLTETSPTVSVMRADEPRRLGSCGRPIPGIEVAILDDDDLPVAAAETGEVCVRGPNVMQGYYNQPDETALVMRNGWFHTGDMGFVDSDGYLHITERKKDLIIRGGFNVFPRDVEEVLYRHPAVQECAVVGAPDPRLGEEVVAYIVLRPGREAGEEEILRHCRESLARYKTPKRVKFVADLPKNPIGKILKRALRERAAEDFPA